MQIILLWMTGALVIGQLFKYLSLPPLVGFILAGYIFSVFGYHDTNSFPVSYTHLTLPTICSV